MNSAKLTVLITQPDKAKAKTCCIFPVSLLGLKPKIDGTFSEETAKMLESKFMRQVFQNAVICAVMKKSIKNLVVMMQEPQGQNC